MMSEKISIKGHVRLRHWRGPVLLETIEHDNLVMNAGLNLAVMRLGGIAANPLASLAVGDGGAAPSATQSALLGTEHGRSNLTLSATGNVLEAVATIGPFASTVVVRELGVFNATASGVMFSRVTPVEVEMEPTDTIDVNWRLEFE